MRFGVRAGSWAEASSRGPERIRPPEAYMPPAAGQSQHVARYYRILTTTTRTGPRVVSVWMSIPSPDPSDVRS